MAIGRRDHRPLLGLLRHVGVSGNPSSWFGSSSSSSWLWHMYVGCVLFLLLVKPSSGLKIPSPIMTNTNATTTTSIKSTVITYPLVPYHVQRARRRSRELQDEAEHVSFPRRRDIAQQVGALYQGYGTHYVDLWCGTPPQRQTVIVDTGSGVTAFPCSECQDCGVPEYHIDRLFIESESSTYKENFCAMGCKTGRGRCGGTNNRQCRISMSYTEGSRWDAFEAIDKCYVGGPHEKPLLVDGGEDNGVDPNHASHFAFDLVFGCQTLLTGLFKTQLADGIMGMDYRDDGTFWGQMYKAGKMGTSKQFALCFARQDLPERKGTEAGALTLGGVDTQLHLSPMVFSSDAGGGRSGFFSVKLRRILLRHGSAGESAKSTKVNPTDGVVILYVPDTTVNSGGVIVDSGTTDTYWNRGIADAFNAAFKDLSGGRRHENKGWSLTTDELKSLPTILFQIVSDEDSNPGLDPFKTPGLAGVLDTKHPYDVILAFPPSHYMEYDPDDDKYTSRFYVTESRGSVLGANAMMGHDVLFDADNGKIGFAESNCDYTSFVTTRGYEFPITGNLIGPDGVPDIDNNQHSAGTGNVWTKVQNGPATAQKGFYKFMDICDSPECRYPVIIFLVLAIVAGCCLSYCLSCLCCRKRRTDYRYQVAASEEVELVIGSFSDGNSYKDSPERNGNGSNGFKDKPSDKDKELPSSLSNGGRKPEFQGDFI